MYWDQRIEEARAAGAEFRSTHGHQPDHEEQLLLANLADAETSSEYDDTWEALRVAILGEALAQYPDGCAL